MFHSYSVLFVKNINEKWLKQRINIIKLVMNLEKPSDIYKMLKFTEWDPDLVWIQKFQDWGVGRRAGGQTDWLHGAEFLRSQCSLT